MSDATNVLHAIDQLRRDLSGYHGQLKAQNDLRLHCDNQRERITELEGLYARAKVERDETAMAFSKEHDRAEFLMRERAALRELVREMYQCSRQYGCDRCGYKDGCAMFDRMAQLGIEVGA